MGSRKRPHNTQYANLTKEEAIMERRRELDMASNSSDETVRRFYANRAEELGKLIKAMDAKKGEVIDTTYEEVPDRERSESRRKAITKREKG